MFRIGVLAAGRLGLAMVLACAVMALFAPVSSAQYAEGPPKIVRDIEVQYIGAAAVAKDRILANMSTKVGDEFSPASLEQDLKSLYETGTVQNVRMLSEPVGTTGIRLIVVVQTRALLSDVSFLGHSRFKTSRLRSEADLKIGNIVDEIAVQEGRTNIEKLYRDKGYSDAVVNYDIKPGAQQGYSRVVYTIDEGDRSLLREILFEGNTVFTDKELRKEMELREKSLWAVFSKRGKLDNNQLEDDIGLLEAFYQNAGYLNARVTNVSKVRVDKEKIDLLITIFEGDKYDVAQVSITGMQAFSEDELIPALRLVAGEPYSAAIIEQDTSTLRDYYGSRGYAEAQITPIIDDAGTNLLAVNYSVFEGGKYYIRKINIDGNTKTQDRVIRRELKVAPGDEYNTVRLRASENVLNNIGYFSVVEVLDSETNEPGFRDVNITVAEKSTGSINFGLGFSSIDSLVGFVDITQSNFDLWNWPRFTGAGQKFRLGIKAGSERRDFVMSITEPWFLGRQLSLSGEVFYRDVFFVSDIYDQREYGGELALRKPVGEHSSLRFGYLLQSVDIRDIQPLASPQIQAEAGRSTQSQLSVDFLTDTRDSVFLPRNGHKLALGASLSGEILGGDVDAYGMSLAGEKYFSLPFDMIFSVEGEVALKDATKSGGRVPIYDRLFLGGANNLRGFDFRDVGPKDAFGEPLGGLTSVFGSAELTVPIFKDKVRGAVFYDVGVVNSGAYDLSFSNYNSNWGLGLRIVLPVGPVRLDYGIPIESDRFNDSGGRFNFNLGYQF